MTSFFLVFILVLSLFVVGILIGLKLNKRTFHQGKLVIINSGDGKRTFSLDMDINPDEIKDLDIIVFKVVEEEYNE